MALTFERSAAPSWGNPSRAALARLTDDDVGVERLDTGEDGWIAFAGADEYDSLGPPSGAFSVVLGRLSRTREAELTTAELTTALSDDASLRALLPPIAVAHRADRGAPVRVATDWLGFRQLFWWRGEGAAAVSTSARALSELAGGGLDMTSVGAQAMIGWQIGDGTPFASVRALRPATVATLLDGRLEFRQYAPPLTASGQRVPLDDAVDEMAAILRAWQSRYLEAHPDTVLQLTGGIDSRILLGAIPPEQRRGMSALTLGEETHPDVVISRKLAFRYGLRHETHRLDAHVPTPSEAHQLALSAARALECQASPMALVPLLLVEAQLDQGDRLSGLGGEVARGFYYAGQPANARTSPRLVERLAEWRIFANESVEPAALDPSFLADARDNTLSTLIAIFESGEWLRATDNFYLYNRMHRWGGAHGTVAAIRRRAVNPMFDRSFIELALAVAPEEKRDSRLLGRLMTRLDPELADMPLDSGLIPARLGAGGLATRLAVASVTARRGVGKLSQRLARRRRPQLGAALAADLVLTHWRTSPSACEGLYDLPMLDRRWVQGLVRGQYGAAPTTVAFLVNLLAMVSEPEAD